MSLLNITIFRESIELLTFTFPLNKGSPAMNGKNKLSEQSQVSPTPNGAISSAAIANGTHHAEINGEFVSLLKRLSVGVGKGDIKQREGWRDRNGQTHYVDYVEWHCVADLLDKLVPTWSHSVRNIIQIGEFAVATAAITINGVTREGVGTGLADSETGIKKAEHDALKRAAVKFGVARDLYRDEEKSGEPADQSNRHQIPSLTNPIARTINELISPKQIALIKRLAASASLDPEERCEYCAISGVAYVEQPIQFLLSVCVWARLQTLPRRPNHFEMGAGVFHFDPALSDQEVEKSPEGAHFKVDCRGRNRTVSCSYGLRTARIFIVIDVWAIDRFSTNLLDDPDLLLGILGSR
jgi:hypothetical protein